MANNKETSGGLTFFGALTLLFIGLKLGNVIDWPWWSWNLFTPSVFIIQLWSLFLILVGILVALIYLGVKEAKKAKEKSDGIS